MAVITDNKILKNLDAMSKICPDINTASLNNDAVLFQSGVERMQAELIQLFDNASVLAPQVSNLFLPAARSILDSFKTIVGLFGTAKAPAKAEFELLPLIQEAYLSFYKFGVLAEHPELIPEFNKQLLPKLSGNKYIDKAIKSGLYKYEVSIVVLAYNKLEYTQNCIHALLSHMPENLDCELILVNHGSTDGTKEYFESVNPHKQLDISVNGGGISAVFRIVEGKYILFISNDVLVLPNAIENLLKTMKSDSRIAWAVPSTPNISNMQPLSVTYSNVDEMLDFAKINNIYDPSRHEQRTRLCNPIEIMRSDIFYSTGGLNLNGAFHSLNPKHAISFPDDRISLLLRRNGYKMALVKDAYCHHFGSVTLKDEIAQQGTDDFYIEGRQIFKDAYGVDPWGLGCCYDHALYGRVVGEEKGHIDILGINCGLGSNSLKIKEQIKEHCRNEDTYLLNITEDACYIDDLKGISDEAVVTVNLDNFKESVNARKWKYIIWEQPFLQNIENKIALNTLVNALDKDGKLLIKANEYTKENDLARFSEKKEIGDGWCIFSGV